MLPAPTTAPTRNACRRPAPAFATIPAEALEERRGHGPAAADALGAKLEAGEREAGVDEREVLEVDVTLEAPAAPVAVGDTLEASHLREGVARRRHPRAPALVDTVPQEALALAQVPAA